MDARTFRIQAAFATAGLLLPAVGAAQNVFAADYELTRAPGQLSALPHLSSVTTLGRSGLSLRTSAGASLFTRLEVERRQGSATDMLGLGGGYVWRDGQSLSVQVLRGTLSDRVGLAVRYDWTRYYLRLSYDRRWGEGTVDLLRLSAGFRF